MRLSTRVHGLMDYGLGVALVVLASTLPGGIAGTAGMVFVVTAIIIVVSALMTDFESGLVRKISIPLHLWLDGIIGLAVGVSPWLLGFDRDVWLPHLLVGAAIIGAAFLTNTIPSIDRRRASTT